MRFGLGWAEPEFGNGEDAVKIVRIPFDILYHWNRGEVRSFVGAGMGAYLLTLKDNGRTVGDSESRLGATLFGGAEFFATRSTTVKGELRYHIIDELRGVEPDGFSLTIGLKRYFQVPSRLPPALLSRARIVLLTRRTPASDSFVERTR